MRVIDKKYPINKVLTPSIKFEPLIRTNKQNITKKYLNIVNVSKLSKNGILIETIKFSLKNIRTKIIDICKINLFNGDFK